MKNNKIITICLGSVLLVGSITTTALAFTHSSDNFKYASLPGLSSQAQSSEFYCGQQSHTATARVKVGSKIYDAKSTASAGKWAKAKTAYYKGVTEWNAYYSHI